MTDDKFDDLLDGTDVDPEAIKEWDEAKALLLAIEGARKSGLESEFIIWFLRFYREGQSVAEAIWGAQCEWDL